MFLPDFASLISTFGTRATSNQNHITQSFMTNNRQTLTTPPSQHNELFSHLFSGTLMRVRAHFIVVVIRFDFIITCSSIGSVCCGDPSRLFVLSRFFGLIVNHTSFKKPFGNVTAASRMASQATRAEMDKIISRIEKQELVSGVAILELRRVARRHAKKLLKRMDKLIRDREKYAAGNSSSKSLLSSLSARALLAMSKKQNRSRQGLSRSTSTRNIASNANDPNNIRGKGDADNDGTTVDATTAAESATQPENTFNSGKVPGLTFDLTLRQFGILLRPEQDNMLRMHLQQRRSQTAAEEAQGAGLVNFGMVVTATVTEKERLPDAVAAVEQTSGTARVLLRRAYGAQDTAFAASLPLGLVLPKHSLLPSEIKDAL